MNVQSIAFSGVGLFRLATLLVLFATISASTLAAQDLIISGQVKSSDGEPLSGVSILIKGSGLGTYSNDNGRFEITVLGAGGYFFRNDPPPVLVFSHLGYRNYEVPIQEQKELDIVLQPEAAGLEEVVVLGSAVGHSPKLMSFAVGHIGRELLSPAPAPNLGTGLQGKVPGLRVNQIGGQPGQGAFFQVRSANAIANGQQPLIIVDGIFLNGSTLADFNAEDIEKVEILKGSAGASLYGSQAANGVIEIFTQRGKNLAVGETHVVYRGEVGYSQPTRTLELNERTNRSILQPDGPQPSLGDPDPDNLFDTPLPNLQNYQEDYLFRQRGLFHTNSISVSGKGQATNFFASAQRLQDEGILQGFNGYTRNAFRLNFDHQLSNRFDLQVSSQYSFSKQDLHPASANGPGSFLAGMLFLTPMFDLDAVNEEDGSAADWDIDNSGYGTTNPLYERANSSQTVDRSRLLGNISTNYYAKDWLTLSYSAALDRSTNDFEHFLRKGYLSTSVPGAFGPLATFSVQNSNGGGIHRSQRQTSYFVSRFSALAQHSFSGFQTALRASILYEDLNETFSDGIGENLATDNVRSLDNARSNVSIASRTQDIIAYSGFLLADVDYQQKYLFSGLIRREGSSLFGPEERWANYYRMSAGYRLSEDIRIKGFQELKLRASVGTAGIRPTFDQRFETYQLINGAILKNTLGNRALRPAASRELEVGVDAVLFRAFELEFNYAQIRTTDQILLVPLSAAAGFVGQWRNAGTIEAKVYEVGLQTDLARLFRIKTAGFQWKLGLNFDRTRQSIVELSVPSYTTGPGPQQASLFLIEEGQPLGAMVGEVFATSLEQLQDQKDVDAADYTLNAAGYVVRKDQLGSPDELPYKLRDDSGNPLVAVIGDINPDFRMGIAHTLEFKGLQLYTLFDWKKGGDIYNYTRQWLYRDQRHGDVSRYPDIAAGFYGSNGLYNLLVANNHFVEDGSFFMLREASLSYTFHINRAIDQLRLSVIGRNLFTITDYSGFHPDVSSPPREENTLFSRVPDARGSEFRTPNGDPMLFAVDAFNYPLARTVTFSLQLSF